MRCVCAAPFVLVCMSASEGGSEVVGGCSVLYSLVIYYFHTTLQLIRKEITTDTRYQRQDRNDGSMIGIYSTLRYF